MGSVCLLDATHLGSCSLEVDRRCESGGHGCPTGLLCVGDRCANTCTTDHDCPSDGLCRVADTTGQHFCFAPGRDDAGVPNDGSVPVDANVPPDAGPVSRTYVIGRFLSGDDLPGGQAYGFDLDMMVGGAAGLPCTGAIDFTSPISGNTGIDNQYGTIVPTFDAMLGTDGYDGRMRDRILSGDYLMVLQVDGIDSFLDDPSVMVRVVRAQGTGTGGGVTAGADCVAHVSSETCRADATNACSWRSATSECLGLQAGQSLASSATLGTFAGAIRNSRLEFQTTLPLDTPFVSVAVPTMPVRNARFAAHISSATLSEGEIGGTVLLDDLVAGGMSILSGFDRSTAESFVQPDLGPDATGAHCANISAGLRFDAITATLR